MTLTSDQIALQNFLKASNEAAKAKGFVGMVVEDAQFWSERNINSVEEFEIYDAQCTLWDIYKDVYGVRPRHMDINNMSLGELRSEIDYLCKCLEGQLEAEREEKELLERAKAETKRRIKEAMTCVPLTQGLFD